MAKSRISTGEKRSDRDRRVRQADRVGRILTVLRLIQSNGQWNAEAIAREIRVTERTVYRDLKALEFAGVPWFYNSEQQSYRVRSDFRFSVPNLTENEVIGQAVAAAITNAPGLNAAGNARPTTQKIAAASNEATKQLLADVDQVVSVLGLQLADHSRHLGIIQTAQQALIRKRKVKGVYSSPYEAQPIELRLVPFRLCLVKNAWYLIARPVDADQPKTYRIARFDSLDVLDQPAVAPQNFDLSDYFGNAWAVFRGSKTFDIRLQFLPSVARIVTETQWHPTQQAEPKKDGSFTLTFRIDGLEEICNWLLGWSGSVKVLAPKALRVMVAEKLKAGLKLNS